MLDSFFGIKKGGSSVGREVLAGVTTFIVMAYIIFVNPAILSFAGIKDLQGLGPPFVPTMAVTCLMAGIMIHVYQTDQGEGPRGALDDGSGFPGFFYLFLPGLD